MREFKAENWWRAIGRGDVASVINDEDFEKDECHLFGEKVLIDGHVYTVKGVEAHCLQTIRKGSPISLLVAEDHVPERHYLEHSVAIAFDMFSC
jgi:hypothetical protein